MKVAAVLQSLPEADKRNVVVGIYIMSIDNVNELKKGKLKTVADAGRKFCESFNAMAVQQVEQLGYYYASKLNII